VITDPLRDEGASHETATEAFPGTPVTDRGTDGTVFGITAPDAVDGTESPAALRATTVNV